MHSKINTSIQRPKAKSHELKASPGFTIMEIVVATTIFAIVTVGMTTLFTYTLKINRRAEALRQATQGMRDFVEGIVKEVRNGQIDYGVIDPGGSTVVSSALGQCDIKPAGSSYNASTNGGDSYTATDNRLAILDTDGNRECFYLGDANGTWVGSGVTSGKTLVLEKAGGIHQIVNPPNYTVDRLAFFVRPLCDPYSTNCTSYGGVTPKLQPFLTIAIQFTTKLSTGETVPIYYQTTVSGDKYDVPHTP